MKIVYPFSALLLAALLCAVSPLRGQQISRRTQFSINTYMVNPAVAGTMNYAPFFATYRNQWAGFKGAPTTVMASGHAGVWKGLGVGGIAYRDDTGGAIAETGMELTAAYHLDLNNFDAVSFGLSLNASQYSFDNSRLIVTDPTDQALNGGAMEREINMDATFGFLVYGKQYYAGFSIPQLLESNLRLQSEINPSENRNQRHYQVMGSYKYYASDKWDVQPSLFMRFTGNTPVQVDLNVRGIYNQMAFGGLTYRHRDAVALMIGSNYREFVVSYSYDLTTSRARILSPHTHEIIIGYYLARKVGKFRKSSLGPRVLDRGRVVN